MNAPDEVNQAMIRHFVEAVGDENPVYTDEKAARAAGFPGVIAPPQMLQAWVMRGYKASYSPAADRERTAHDEIMTLLDSEGFTSVVATDCEQEYMRPLVLGDRIAARSVIESISDKKSTGLGEGHFFTTRLEFVDQAGDLVATMRFRILKFRPSARPAAPQGEAAPERPSRPMPAVTKDNSFFFEGAARGELLIQRCESCGTLRHPPRPGCPKCRSLDWGTVASSGRGAVFSFVVVHYPQVGAFDYPLPVVLVELEEGTRVISNIEGVEPADIRIGMPVEVGFARHGEALTLPVFRPASVEGP
ncbi:MAG: bifunctional MaoC family dehydratase N-terminal/OB-fold nucleic acid binding domain-containing protein [Acidimicrobiales bacterium]